jgi:hypothetical protein
MNTPERPSAPHPWNIHFKPGEEDRLRSELIVPLFDGMIEAGASFRHVRKKRPFRMFGTYHFDLDGRPWGLRLLGYCSVRWAWRITYGTPVNAGGLANYGELTLAIEEVCPQFGRDLAAMLGSLARGEKPEWEMFNTWESFPQYSWSQLCWARYQGWEKWRKARREFLAAKSKTRTSAT